MKLTRKNNALTNDVVSMYDYVGYAEQVGAAVTDMANQANIAILNAGGGGGSVSSDAPFVVKAAIVVGYTIYAAGKWLFD